MDGKHFRHQGPETASLSEELPPVSFEAARFNEQVLLMNGIVMEVRRLAELIGPGNEELGQLLARLVPLQREFVMQATDFNARASHLTIAMGALRDALPNQERMDEITDKIAKTIIDDVYKDFAASLAKIADDVNATLQKTVFDGARQIAEAVRGIPPIPPATSVAGSPFARLNALLNTAYIRWRRFCLAALPEMVMFTLLANLVYLAVSLCHLKP